MKNETANNESVITTVVVVLMVVVLLIAIAARRGSPQRTPNEPSVARAPAEGPSQPAEDTPRSDHHAVENRVNTASTFQAPRGVWTDGQELRCLRALLIIDSNSDLTQSVERDLNTMQWILTSQVPPERLTLTVLRGYDATPANVLKYYRDLNTGPNECVLCYYSGHGGVRDNRYMLAMQAGDLDRETLVGTMRSRNPGLTVLLTDCCSSIVPSQKVYSQNAPQVSSDDGQGQLRQPHHLARCLFLQHRGIIDKTAALHGMTAYGDDQVGGYFTASLAMVFAYPQHFLPNGGRDFVTWDTFDVQTNNVLARSFSGPRANAVQTAGRFLR